MSPLRMAIAAALLFAPAAHAEEKLTVGDMVRYAAGDDFFKAVIFGGWEGASWMQGWFESRGAEVAFCPPAKLSMNGDAVLTMVRKYLEEHPEDNARSSGQMAYVTIKAAQFTFPCQ